jgi:hypothetical protein
LRRVHQPCLEALGVAISVTKGGATLKPDGLDVDARDVGGISVVDGGATLKLGVENDPSRELDLDLRHEGRSLVEAFAGESAGAGSVPDLRYEGGATLKRYMGLAEAGRTGGPFPSSTTMTDYVGRGRAVVPCGGIALGGRHGATLKLDSEADKFRNGGVRSPSRGAELLSVVDDGATLKRHRDSADSSGPAGGSRQR